MSTFPTNHNGGPSLDHPDTIRLRHALSKLQTMREIGMREDLSMLEKSITYCLVLHSDHAMQNAWPSATVLARFASVRKRDTVYAAINELVERHKILRRKSGQIRGKANVYDVLAAASMTEFDEAGSGWIAEPNNPRITAQNVAPTPFNGVGGTPLNGVGVTDLARYPTPPDGVGDAETAQEGCGVSTAPPPANGVPPTPFNGVPPRTVPAFNETGTALAPRARASRLFEEVKDKKEGRKEDSYTSPPVTQTASATRVAVQGLGEEEGAAANLEVTDTTIRHPAFVISLEGIYMQLLGNVPRPQIKAVAMGHALQWAADYAAGKKNVAPSNPGSFIRGSIQSQQRAATSVPTTSGRAYRPSNEPQVHRVSPDTVRYAKPAKEPLP